MKIIDRYLGQTIFQTISIVMLALIGLELFILLIGELGDIGRGNYSVLSAFFYVILTLPQEIYTLFPMAGLLGMLMGLGLLANHSELIILQGAGLSPLQIALKTLKTILLLIIAITILGEFIAPYTNYTAQEFKSQKMHPGSQESDLGRDIWLRVNNNYLHVTRIDKQRILHGITLFQFNSSGELLRISRADTVIFENHQWRAANVDTTLMKGDRTASEHKATLSWPFNVSPELVQNTIQEPNQLSLSQLQRTMNYHHHIQNSSNAVQLAFWRRLMQPLASLVMMLLAIPFIFGPLRHANHSFRLVAGIAIGFLFYYSNQFFGPFTLLLHWPAFVGAILPTIIFAVVGLLLLRKT